MRKPPSLYIKTNIDRLIGSLLGGLMLSMVLRLPFYSFLHLGYSFYDRSILFKTLFTSLLAGSLAILFYFFFGKFLIWLIHNYFISIAFLTCIPLAAYSLMGWYSRFVADDFSSATLAVNKGVLGATWDWYINWSGRFSASFMDSVIGFFGPLSARYMTGISILLWCIGIIWVLINLLPGSKCLSKFGASIVLSALIIISTFELTPLISQSLYWGQGMRSVVVPLVLGTFLSGLSVILIKNPFRHSFFFYLFIGALSFIAGGFGETYVALQTSAFIIVLLFALFYRPHHFSHRIIWGQVIGLLGSIFAMMIIIAAPGNQIRQGYFPPSPDLPNIFLISLESMWQFAAGLLTDNYHLEIILVLMLASIFIGSVSTKNSPEGNKYPGITGFFGSIFRSYLLSAIFIILTTTVLLLACFVPSAYGMSTHPPDRTLVIPACIFALGVMCFGVLTGTFAAKHVFRVTAKILSPYRKIFAWASFFLFVGFIFQVTSNILVLRKDYQYFAKVFDYADESIRQAKADGMAFVEVPEVHNHYGLSDYGAGTTLWLDDAVNSYYGINVIINKNLKVK